MNITNPMQQLQQQQFAKGGAVYLANGTQPSREQIIQFIRKTAAEEGIDPDIALRVAIAEGLNARPEEGYQSFVRDDKGNREESYGVFQLNMEPGAIGDKMLKSTGVHPKDDVYGAIKWALKTAKNTGWGPWMGAKAIGLKPRQGIGGNPSPASDTEVVDNKRVRNPADVAAGIGGEQDGTFAGGATPQEIEDADAFSFFDFLKSKKGAFKDFSNDVGDAVLNQKRRYAPSGGMMKGAAQAAAQYGKREMDLVNAYKKAAEAALQDPGAPEFMGRGLMSLAHGGAVKMVEGGLPADESRIQWVIENFGVDREAAKRMIENNPGIGISDPNVNIVPPVGPAEAEQQQQAVETAVVEEFSPGSPRATGRPPAMRPGEGQRGGLNPPSPPWNPSPAELQLRQNLIERELAAKEAAKNQKKQPTELDLYEQYMKNMLRLNKEFLDERRQKAEDARGGGLGSFLRRLGIGVLSSPSGKFGDMLASGVTNVASAQSKAQQEYLDRIGKLDEAELAYQLQSAKLPYELAKLKRESSGLATPSSIQKYLIDQIDALDEKETEILKLGSIGGSDEQLRLIRDQRSQLEQMLQQYGYPAMPKSQTTAVSAEQLNTLGN